MKIFMEAIKSFTLKYCGNKKALTQVAMLVETGTLETYRPKILSLISSERSNLSSDHDGGMLC